MAASPAPDDPGRREFLKRVAVAGLATSVPPFAAAFAQTPPPGGTPAAPSPAAAPAADVVSAEARALRDILKARFGDRLTAEQWDSVAADFDGDLASGKRLRATKLANGDEPDFTFRA